MPRDYKHRVHSDRYRATRRPTRSPVNIVLRWLFVIALLIAFGVFLNMLRKIAPELISSKPIAENHPVVEQLTQEVQITQPAPVETPKKPEPQPAAEPEEPRFDFYTILPQAETVVPDYEIKTRVREELVGKTKAAKYMMQAGSFRESAEAETQKAKLALLGIQSRIEKAKVGDVIWHRVKVGPYDNPSSVSTIKELLQKNGFGVIVTESGQ